MLSLAEFRENAGTGGCTLKATKCAIQGFAFLHSNFCHFSPPLRGLKQLVADPGKRRRVQLALSLYTIFPRLSRAFFFIFQKTVKPGAKALGKA